MVSAFLTSRGKVALIGYMHAMGLTSFGQALNQICMRWLYENGYMPKEDWNRLQDSKVMMIGSDFLQEERIRQNIEAEEIVEEEEKVRKRKVTRLLRKYGNNDIMASTLKILIEQPELVTPELLKSYEERTKQYPSHPLTQEIKKRIKELQYNK